MTYLPAWPGYNLADKHFYLGQTCLLLVYVINSPDGVIALTALGPEYFPAFSLPGALMAYLQSELNTLRFKKTPVGTGAI